MIWLFFFCESGKGKQTIFKGIIKHVTKFEINFQIVLILKISNVLELWKSYEEFDFHYLLVFAKAKIKWEIKNFEGENKWTKSSESVQRKHIVFLQNELEVVDKERRLNAMWSLLYLVQGIKVLLKSYFITGLSIKGVIFFHCSNN